MGLARDRKEAEVAPQMIARGDVRAGDVVVIAGHRVGEVERTGEVLEVLGPVERPHFLVRWDDGHESVYYPGNDATVRRARPRPAKTSES
jgi:rRNA processing protein Gar1